MAAWWPAVLATRASRVLVLIAGWCGAAAGEAARGASTGRRPPMETIGGRALPLALGAAVGVVPMPPPPPTLPLACGLSPATEG